MQWSSTNGRDRPGADVRAEFIGTIGAVLAGNIHRAVLSWREQGIELLPGRAVEEIRHLAKLGHVNLSADIELLYSLCGGMQRGTVDDKWFELRPLERLLQDAKKYPYSLLPFAEGFLSAQLYCLRVEGASTASVHMDFSFEGNSAKEISPTLDTMCRLLLDDPTALCLP